jgi:uncharacterized protein (DUF111 family)
VPNVLRVLAFAPSGDADSDQVAVLAFEVDDMTGEEIGTAAARLRAVEGVLDLTIFPGWGKKNRPVQSFQLLVRPEARAAVTARCFSETATIGLRHRLERREVLSREARPGVKEVVRPGGERTRKAESDGLTGETLAARRAMKAAAEHG